MAIKILDGIVVVDGDFKLYARGSTSMSYKLNGGTEVPGASPITVPVVTGDIIEVYFEGAPTSLDSYGDTLGEVHLYIPDSVTDMYNCFYGHSNMTKYTQTGGGNVADYSFAWANCTGLTDFPVVDTSGAQWLGYTWQGCTGLTAFPILNTSATINFKYAWKDCTGLTTIPNLDYSAATDLSASWWGCTGITTVPDMDISSVELLSSAWRGCTSLVTVGTLNTPVLKQCAYSFRDCTALETIYGLDTRTAFSKTGMFQNCVSLVNPTIDEQAALASSEGALYKYSALPNCSDDHTAIYNALMELKTQLETLKLKIGNGLVVSMSEIIQESGGLYNNVINPILLSETSLSGTVNLDITDVMVRLSDLELKVSELEVLSSTTEGNFSQIYVDSRASIVSLSAVQDEIKSYLIQARNLINS